METKNLAGLYDLPAMRWDAVRERLDQGFEQAPGDGGPDRHTCWLTTVNPDGSPHVTGVGADYHDGTFRFTASRSSVKGRNLARDPRCALALAVHEFDLVLEARAELVTDHAEVAAAAVARVPAGRVVGDRCGDRGAGRGDAVDVLRCRTARLTPVLTLAAVVALAQGL
jgi:hypothetical protein